MRIYLTGFMGAGKSTVGRLLAGELDWSFVDLDEEIERQTGIEVREIFERDGECRFRDLEEEALCATLERRHAVIATGGGVVTREENRRRMRQGGKIVWLHPDLATIRQRIEELDGAERGARPLLGNLEEVEGLFLERLPLYRDCDLEIGVAPDEDPGAVANRIVQLLSELECDT